MSASEAWYQRRYVLVRELIRQAGQAAESANARRCLATARELLPRRQTPTVRRLVTEIEELASRLDQGQPTPLELPPPPVKQRQPRKRRSKYPEIRPGLSVRTLRGGLPTLGRRRR